LSLKKLKFKKRAFNLFLSVFFTILLALFALCLFMLYVGTITPIVIVPISLLPMCIIGLKKLKAINKELELRSS